MRNLDAGLINIFIDTNVIIHGQALAEIDFFKFIDAKEICIILSRVIINELDRNKTDHNKKHIRERIAKRLKTIEGYIEHIEIELRPGIRIAYLNQHFGLDFQQYNLDPLRPDDKLIAEIIRFKNENPSLAVKLISQDTGPRLTAKANKIEALELPFEFVLKPEKDPIEQKNEELTKQLEKFQTALPKLILKILNDGKSSDFKSYKFIPPPKIEIDKNDLLSSVRATNPTMHKPQSGYLQNEKNPYKLFQSALTGLPTHEISEAEYERYNHDLEEYFKKYSEYLDALIEFKYAPYLRLDLSIILENNGLSPANDIDVFLHFPNGFELFNKDDFLIEPTAPALPEKPGSIFSLLNKNLYAGLPLPYSFHSQTKMDLPSAFSIKKTNSYEVRQHFKGLKQNLTIEIEPMIVLFPSYTVAQSFQISYKIIASNFPGTTEGNLHVIIEKV